VPPAPGSRENGGVAAIPGSLRALLSNLIDYAGLYPPAALPLREVSERYQTYRQSPHSWILNRLILPAAKLQESGVGEDWRISLLVDDEPGVLPAQVETLETKLARRLSLPTYCEAPPDQVTDAFAKLRTGGLSEDSIPSPETIAGFLHRAAARRLPFKATAGLHHPIRSQRALTYAADSPRATMHGFVNVFVAAAFAWYGHERDQLLEILTEEDTRAFQFAENELRFRGRTLSTVQIQAARDEFAHSFGSCSFEEPISDLRQLGFLP
jgi:hypothetical protein